MARYDIAILIAHGEGDSGCSGNGTTEYALSTKIVKDLVSKLTKQGVTVLHNIDTGYNNYNRNICKGHIIESNIATTWHLNSFKDSSANGCEAIIPCSENYYSIEADVLQLLGNYKIKNRGIKSRDYESELFFDRSTNHTSGMLDYYKEIRDSWKNSLSHTLYELFFLSNPTDYKNFMDNYDKIITGIANIYLEYLGKKPITTEPTQPTKLYKVVTGTFSNKANAEKRVQELKNNGFDSYILS